jgi:hypothetical protein
MPLLIRAAFLMLKVIFSIGILSIPSEYFVLGAVPGGILTVVWTLINTCEPLTVISFSLPVELTFFEFQIALSFKETSATDTRISIPSVATSFLPILI